MTSVIKCQRFQYSHFVSLQGFRTPFYNRTLNQFLMQTNFHCDYNAYCLKGQKVTPRGKERLMLILTFVPMIDPCKMG